MGQAGGAFSAGGGGGGGGGAFSSSWTPFLSPRNLSSSLVMQGFIYNFLVGGGEK